MRNLKVIFAALIFATISLTSCTDASLSKIGGYGDEFKVELINCDGSITYSWISSGKVSSEANSDGYYFMEKSTSRLIEVTGTLIITKLDYVPITYTINK